MVEWWKEKEEPREKLSGILALYTTNTTPSSPGFESGFTVIVRQYPANWATKAASSDIDSSNGAGMAVVMIMATKAIVEWWWLWL